MSDHVIRIIIDPRGAESGGDRAKRAIRGVNGEAERADKQMASLGRTLNIVKAGFFALVGSSVLRELGRLADTSKTLSAQLMLVEGSTAKVRDRQRELVDLSVRTGTALGANVDLYRKVKGALVETYGEGGKYLRVTESISKAMIISGADANTASGAIRQLGQALGSGAFRGDEFNSVAEAAPRLMKMLGDSLDVPTTKLRAMAAEGELTSDKLYKALSDRRFTEGLDREFKMMPMTFGRAVENVKSAATVVFGEFDRGGRFSNSILNFANFGSQDIEKLGVTAHKTGQEIEAAFSALSGVFDPMLLGANSVFDAIGVKSLSLRDQIKEVLDIVYELWTANDKAAAALVRGAGDTADLLPKALSGGRWTPFGNRANRWADQLDDKVEQGRWSTRYEELAEARTAGGLGNRSRGTLRDIRGRAAQIVADRERAKKAAEGTATADAASAKELEKAAKEASNRLKAANDNLESASRELELMRAVWDGDVERTRLRHELEDIDSVRDGLSKAELAILGPILDKTKAITEEKYRQARYAEQAADSVSRLDPGALHDPDKDLADLKRGFQEAGRAGGRALRDESLLAAEAFGQALGGHVGGVIRQLAGVLQGMKSGDFTGVGGPIGGILTLLGGSGGYKMIGGGAALPGGGTMSRLPDLTAGGMFRKGMKDVFGDALDPLKRAGKEIASAFGANGAFTETLGRAFGGAGVGTATGGVMKALGIKSSTTGAQVGGAIGGMIPIPGGAIIGSVAGGLLGGVLKGILNPARTARANITGVDDALGLGGKDSKNYGTASDLGASVQDGLRNIADTLGAEIGKFNVTIGVRDKDYRVNTSGTSLKTGKGAVNFGDDAEAAVAYAIRDAIRDGALKGISDFSQRALKSTLELEQAVDVAAKYEQVLKSLNSSNAIEAAAKEFVSGFDSLVTQMKKVGITAEELANVETYYSQQREKALKDLLDPLLDYRKSLSGEGSGVTAMERFNTSKLEYEQAKSDFASGLIDQNALTAAGQELFGLARDIFGTATDEFQNLRKALLADSNAAIDTATAAFNAGAPERLLAAQEAANTIASQQYQQQVIANQQLAAIQQALAGLYGGGGLASGYYANGVWVVA